MKVGALNLVQRRKTIAFLEKAKNAQRIGRWADAYEAYRMVLGKDDRRFGILVQMGHMSKEMGDFGRAELHYREALALKPDDWDLHVQFGHLFNRSGQLEKAKVWYSRANEINATSEIIELLRSVDNGNNIEDVVDLRRITLEHMDARRFQEALPYAVALYEFHGVRDFDVIVGHALRELGRYTEAKHMYEIYLERCISSGGKNLSDAFLYITKTLEILGDHEEILSVFVKIKGYYFKNRRYSDFDNEQAALLQSYIEKLYGVFRSP